jgi:TatD DNase family protein
VGEIGLDYRDTSDEDDRQKEAFSWQLNEAAERNLPVSIHCVKALNDLLALLKTKPLPARGVHLHAFNGSAEQATECIKLGAYFSFNVGQLHPPAKKAPAALRTVPEDRLLIETDAESPDDESADSLSLLQEGYQLAAELRAADPPTLAAQVEANFKRYFLND